MKKIKVFVINDGLDGIIVAKSIKQAIKKIAPFYYPYKVNDFISSIKKCQKDSSYDGDWTLTNVRKVAKKGKYRKTKVLGWCE
ncbi:hypothetical protein IAI10_16085 [Clostridium sp. 19966]|uniref:hypothetical protein n=1 Tax=Clostridium sp. 19966 TaxID=2768166 RepID=UPI0028DE98D6|nr:hypothetical protein [Clostridium sp. 19966]MDT8718186.1 hypothetical protein [Clostridium sp. 19966]